MRSILLLFAVLALIAPSVQAKDDELVAEALAKLDEGGVAAARKVLESRSPREGLAGFDALMQKLYWERKDLGNTVAIGRAGIVYGMAAAEQEPDRSRAIRSGVKTIAYNLASFTWPGWGEEKIVIRAKDKEAGLRAARLNLELAQEIEQTPEVLSAAWWAVGAQNLAAGRPEVARKAFEKAGSLAVSAGDPLGKLLNDGYEGLALLVGESGDGAARFDGAVRALTAEGRAEATFYAEQLGTARRVFSGTPRRDGVWLTKSLRCGDGLTLEIHLSRTAQLFHVVDQLSGWSQYCHLQYRRAMKLSKEDEVVLARFAAIRKRKGWSGGLEQTFYRAASLDEAVFEGVKAGHLGNGEAMQLREHLLHFAVPVDRLIEQHRDGLTEFVAKLEARADLFTASADELGRLTGVESQTIPVYPIVNPGRGWGGGMNGGRLTIEVPAEGEVLTTFLHEVSHAFFDQQKPAIAAAAKGVSGLDEETLGEALAYAYAPGLRHVEEGDPLAERVAAHRARGQGLDGPNRYARFRIYGLAIRPALEKGLETGDFEETLNRAVAIWKSLTRDARPR